MKLLAGFLAFAATVLSLGFSESGYDDDTGIEGNATEQRHQGFTYNSSVFSGWGLRNARTSVGHLFSYRFTVEPDTAMKVVEHGKTELPDWLHLSTRSVDPLSHRYVLHLEGVSGPLERGKRFYIQISYGDFNNSQTFITRNKTSVQHSANKNISIWDIRDDSFRREPFRDTFTIAVDDDVSGEHAEKVDVNEAAESASSMRGACLKDRTVTRATVIIDADFYKMTSESRVSLVHRFCRHLRLPLQLVQLLPADNEGSLIDADWLVAGPGDTTGPTQGHAGVVIQWDVGCNNVLASQIPVLQMLERTVQNGSLRRAVGRGVIGWHVTKKTQLLGERLKRETGRRSVLPTGTMVRIHMAPTARHVQTTTIVSNQEPSASVGPGLRPSLPQASVASTYRRLADISGRKASAGRQAGKGGLAKERESRKLLRKNLLSQFATPTIVSVKPTRVLHVGTRIIEYESTTSEDEDSAQTSISRFILEPSKPYEVMKLPQATTSLPFSRYRHFTATSESEITSMMTMSHTSIYDQATTLVTNPFEDEIHKYSESLSLTTFLPGNLTNLPGVMATISSVTKHSEMEEAQVSEKSASGLIWEDEEKTPVTTVAIGTIITRETTTTSGGKMDDAIGWMNRWEKSEKNNEFTSVKTPKYRQQAGHSGESTEAPRKPKTAGLPKKALNTKYKTPSAGTTLFKLKVAGSSESASTSIELTSTTSPSEIPTRIPPKGTTPLSLNAFGGRRRLTTTPLPPTVVPNRRQTSPFTPSPSTEAMRIKKTSRRLNKKKTTRAPKRQRKTNAANQGPKVNQEVGNLDVLVGSVFRFRIPNETFQDEDGGTDKLRLLLLTYDTSSWPDDPGDFDRIEALTTVPPNSWVQLNSSTQLLYGLPTEEHFGPHEYWLAAINKEERLTRTRFEIRVRRRPSDDVSLNHEFLAILQLNYEMVVQHVDARIDIVRKIAAAFRDRNTDHVTVTGIRRGSVEFYWTNNTVQVTPCPVKTLTALRDHIISPEGLPTQAFVRAMHPYRLESAGFVPQGGCLNSFTRPLVWGQEMRSVAAMTTTKAADEEVRKKPKESDDGNFLLYILIPMVGFAAVLLLLLVLCIVCHGCRQRKKTRDTKGIPVIFTEEMAADRPPSPRPRPVLADEVTSPFTMPPTYSQSLPGSRFSTMRRDSKTFDDDSSSGLSSDAEVFSQRSIGQTFPGWPPSCGPPPPYIAPYQPRYNI